MFLLSLNCFLIVCYLIGWLLIACFLIACLPIAWLPIACFLMAWFLIGCFLIGCFLIGCFLIGCFLIACLPIHWFQTDHKYTAWQSSDLQGPKNLCFYKTDILPQTLNLLVDCLSIALSLGPIIKRPFIYSYSYSFALVLQIIICH